MVAALALGTRARARTCAKAVVPAAASTKGNPVSKLKTSCNPRCGNSNTLNSVWPTSMTNHVAPRYTVATLKTPRAPASCRIFTYYTRYTVGSRFLPTVAYHCEFRSLDASRHPCTESKTVAAA